MQKSKKNDRTSKVFGHPNFGNANRTGKTPLIQWPLRLVVSVKMHCALRYLHQISLQMQSFSYVHLAQRYHDKQLLIQVCTSLYHYSKS